MKQIITLADLEPLKSIQNSLLNQQSLTSEQQIHLSRFLSLFPVSQNFTSNDFPLNELMEINIEDKNGFQSQLEKWLKLFENIPGYDYVSSWFVQQEELELLSKNVIMIVDFAPSLSYNLSHLDGYYIHLKDNGTASFSLPTFQDAEIYPELYNFKGTWKEAYFLLIETLKKGWPMEEFPEELKPFLKK
jgi:hypothetical protein